MNETTAPAATDAAPGFAARLRARVEAARAREQTGQQEVEAAMRSRLDTEEEVRALYRPVHDEVIHPVVEALGAAFDNCTITHWALPRGLVSQCKLSRAKGFAATARLTVGIEWGERGGVDVVARRDVIPVLASFEGTERLKVDALEPDLPAIRGWLEARVVGFVDACLAIAGEAFYQGGIVRIDPVCGMEARAENEAALLKHEGRSYAFCSAACRARFEAEPATYTASGLSRS
jgi:YHS domain-containing protein